MNTVEKFEKIIAWCRENVEGDFAEVLEQKDLPRIAEIERLMGEDFPDARR